MVTRLGLHEDAFGHPDKGLTLRQGLGNALDVMVAMGWFVAGGICERFPKLTVVFLEGTGGWCAPMLERFDHHIEVFGSRYQKTTPSEIFKRQCYISFDPDEEALAYTANSKYVGADRIVWASDYPHPDAKIPGIVDELEEATETLTDDQRRLIFGENAARLYQHLTDDLCSCNRRAGGAAAYASTGMGSRPAGGSAFLPTRRCRFTSPSPELTTCSDPSGGASRI